MNSLSINISSVSNLLSIFYGVVANTTKKTIESLQENRISLQKTNQLIEELAEAIWYEQDIEFANKEIKKIATLHKLIRFSYEGMKVIAPCYRSQNRCLSCWSSQRQAEVKDTPTARSC